MLSSMVSTICPGRSTVWKAIRDLWADVRLASMRAGARAGPAHVRRYLRVRLATWIVKKSSHSAGPHATR